MRAYRPREAKLIASLRLALPVLERATNFFRDADAARDAARAALEGAE